MFNADCFELRNASNVILSETKNPAVVAMDTGSFTIVQDDKTDVILSQQAKNPEVVAVNTGSFTIVQDDRG